MNAIILAVLFFALSGCETLGPLLEGSFGMEGEGGDKYECNDNLDKCVKRCAVTTKSGAKYFKEFNLAPEKCNQPEPPTPEDI